MPICARACYSYVNNPPLAFLLPVFLDIEAVASVVCSMAYRSAICSMLAFHVFVIEGRWSQGEGQHRIELTSKKLIQKIKVDGILLPKPNVESEGLTVSKA